jgi:hypothetical protein
MPIARSWISLLIAMVFVQFGVNDPIQNDDERFTVLLAGIGLARRFAILRCTPKKYQNRI